MKRYLAETGMILASGAILATLVGASHHTEPSYSTPQTDFDWSSDFEEWISQIPFEPPAGVPLVGWDRTLKTTPRDRLCMQQNVYYEARGEEESDQANIVWVTLNRVDMDHFPNDICDVVWDPHQYSWTRGKTIGVPSFPNEIERRAWERAGEITDRVYAEYRLFYPDPTGGADHYHAEWIDDPFWADRSKVTAYSGQHIMYRLYD